MRERASEARRSACLLAAAVLLAASCSATQTIAKPSQQTITGSPSNSVVRPLDTLGAAGTVGTSETPTPPPATTTLSAPPTVPLQQGTGLSVAAQHRSTPPAPLQPAVSPALPDEGQWAVLASTSDGPVMWGTTTRPLVSRPDVVASFAVFDQTRLRAGLFNGTQLPGGGPWTNGSKVTKAAVPALLAAFNGGFLFKHIQGGYFTEGREVKPLVNGEATIAIRNDGLLTIGLYGTDMSNDGTWTSLRQNLPLIVNDGHETVSTAHEPGVSRIYWGDNFGGVVLDLRSALCIRTDGTMMYATVGKVDINELASVLLSAHCARAMELDINGTWPQSVAFDNPGSMPRVPVALDRRMVNLTRYLVGSTKDFVALFDPSVLPPGVLGTGG